MIIQVPLNKIQQALALLDDKLTNGDILWDERNFMSSYQHFLNVRYIGGTTVTVTLDIYETIVKLLDE